MGAIEGRFSPNVHNNIFSATQSRWQRHGGGETKGAFSRKDFLWPFQFVPSPAISLQEFHHARHFGRPKIYFPPSVLIIIARWPWTFSQFPSNEFSEFVCTKTIPYDKELRYGSHFLKPTFCPHSPLPPIASPSRKSCATTVQSFRVFTVTMSRTEDIQSIISDSH